jgi:precorrin-6B methylase 2
MGSDGEQQSSRRLAALEKSYDAVLSALTSATRRANTGFASNGGSSEKSPEPLWALICGAPGAAVAIVGDPSCDEAVALAERSLGRVVYINADPRACDIALRRSQEQGIANLTVHPGDAATLRDMPEAFDIVAMSVAKSSSAQDELRWARTAVRPQGAIVIRASNTLSLRRPLDLFVSRGKVSCKPAARHSRRFLETAVRSAGFSKWMTYVMFPTVEQPGLLCLSDHSSIASGLKAYHGVAKPLDRVAMLAYRFVAIFRLVSISAPGYIVVVDEPTDH